MKICKDCKRPFNSEIYLIRNEKKYICKECLSNRVSLDELFDESRLQSIKKILSDKGCEELMIDLL